jgi:hypothetical protein
MKPSEFDAGKHTITVAENNRYLRLYFRWQNTPVSLGFELAIFGGVFCYTSAATRATSPAAIDLNRAQIGRKITVLDLAQLYLGIPGARLVE